MPDFKQNFFQRRNKSFGPKYNNRINSSEVQVIDNDGENLGVLNTQEAISKAKKISSLLAINELSILRQSKQASLIQVKINQKILIKKLIGDGILLSTPAGSTAYNLSVNGPILLLNSKKLAITPISPFRPRRWKGKVVTDKAQIFIKNLDPKKRPIAAVADNNEIRNIVSIKASVNKKIKFKLLFNTGESLLKKIKSEQKRKIN